MSELDVEVDATDAILAGTLIGGQIFYGSDDILVYAPNAPGWNLTIFMTRLE